MALDEGTLPWNSREPIEQYDSLFPPLPNFVAYYTVGGEYSEKIGLPSNASSRLGEDILAALIANRMGLSLAYAKKTYVAPFTEWRWLGLTARIDRLFKQGQGQLNSYADLALDLSKEEGTFQDLSTQFFFRNVIALDAAKRLADLGYLCEVAAILRTAMEQFAFAGKLWSLPASTDLQRIRPIECLNYLKNIVPPAGRLYGLLSKYTHFEYDHHTHFFARSSESIFTIQRGSVLRAYSTHLLFLTMVCVSRYVPQIARLQFNELPLPVKELDTFVSEVDAYSNDVCNILKHDIVLAELDILLTKFVKGTD